MADPLPVQDAARALGVTVRTLRRDLAAGAPVVRRGGRGRGRAALVDVAAIEAWRRCRSQAAATDDVLRVIAAEIPEILAAACHTAFVTIDGPHKRQAAGILAGAWYLASVAVLDHLRRIDPTLPDVTAVPEKIDRLRRIFEAGRMVRSSFPRGDDHE